MKPLSDQDHYEMLEIPRDADRDEIERAYRLARATYAEDSLAGYPVFEDTDLELLQERIDLAYRTLTDADARSAYDRALDAQEPACAERLEPGGEERAGVHEPPYGAREPHYASPASHSLQRFDDDVDDTEGIWDGPRLRRARLRSGVEIDEIAKTTKVNPTYLAFIEEERFGELPAAVYTRGFVMGYAGCVGLDGRRVAASYMQRFEASREARRRRLFSRR